MPDPARSFFSELKRRNVFRVGIAYVITAWVVAQVTDLAATNFMAPDWVMKMIITVLVLGFPIALILAWAYEMTPQGLRRDTADQPGGTAQTPRFSRVIALTLVVAVAYFAYDKFMLEPAIDRAMVEAGAITPAASMPPDPVNTTPEPAVQSVAVLPFVNMSADPDNEYFADGLSEELLNTLVNIPELHVAARTSSFSFKGKDTKIADIARELNVNFVLEGSVRKSGDQLRITAQLIKAEDGFHLWSETFDRTMDEIFVIQNEIAGQVAEALEVTLLGASSATVPVKPDSYTAYLKGLHFLQQRGDDNVARANAYFNQAVELDPTHAAAWGTLAFSYYELVNFGVIPRDDGVPLMQDAIERARRLAPGDAVLLGTEGYIRKNFFWDWQGAQSSLELAGQLDPRSPVVRAWQASMLLTLGKLDEAVAMYEDVMATDPLNLSGHSALGLAYTKAHRYDEAIGVFKRQLELDPDYHWGYSNLGKAWLFKGDAERALDLIQKNPDNIFRAINLPIVYHSLGRQADSDAALESLLADYDRDEFAFFIATVFSWRGEKDKAFEWLEKAYRAQNGGIAYMLGDNLLYPLIDDPRWPAYLEKVNLLEYWQAMPASYGGPNP
jgi:adenylate cyclase